MKGQAGEGPHCLRVYQRHQRWRYLLWDATLVTLSSNTPLLAAPPLVFALSGGPMSLPNFSIFPLQSSVITRLHPGAKCRSVVHFCWRVGLVTLDCLAHAFSWC